MATESQTQTSIEFGPERTPEEATEIREGLRRYTPDCMRLEERHDELLAQHGEQWVAMHDGTLFVAAELPVLLGELRGSGVPRATLRSGSFIAFRRRTSTSVDSRSL